MSKEENKAVTRGFFENVWNQGNFDVMEEFASSDIEVHSASQEFTGVDAYKKYIQAYRNAFPDVKFTIKEQIAEDDKVVDRFTVSGTHKGELKGIPPSGKRFEVMGIGISRLKDNKMAEIWGVFDALGMMRQIGAAPQPKQN
jgi:steroid delta-isomerase-like uncharacterized protein